MPLLSRTGTGVIVALTFAACSATPPVTDHEAPAVVDHPRTEAELTTIRLTDQAASRLGIETVLVELGTGAAVRTLGGEVVVPEGRGVVVTAPVAGTLTGAAGPAPGTRVRRGDRLMTLAPLVALERDQLIEARRAVTSAEADELMTRQRVQRVEQLLTEGAAAVRGLEEARAQHAVAQAALSAARNRLTAASQNPQGAQGHLVISAPYDGIVQALSAVPGQTVSAAAPLVQIVQVDTLWVRIPIYAGDVATIDQARPALVKALRSSDTVWRATPVPAPLRGDVMAATVDLFYVVADTGTSLRPGERVLVDLPIRGSAQGLVVPQAAVLYDVHGTAWVYEDLGAHAYARRRVQVDRHLGDRAVVSRGATAGMRVVTAGAAELFGTEFGAGH